MEQENQDLDVVTFETANRRLREFAMTQAAVLTEFRRLSEQYNEALEALTTKVKAISRESGKKAVMGPLRTKLSFPKGTNFDKLEGLVTEEEFREVVRIEYAFKGEKGKEGQVALEKLKAKYGDKLDGLEIDLTPRVTVEGPKPLDLGELDVML